MEDDDSRLTRPNAVNGNLLNGLVVIESGLLPWEDCTIMLPTLLLVIIETLWVETLLSAMILVHHRPLVIFGMFSFIKEHDNLSMIVFSVISHCFKQLALGAF